MIERLQIIATLLRRINSLLILLAVALLALFFYSLLSGQPSTSDALMMPALVGFIWAALLFAVSRLFTTVPPKPGSDHGIGQRLALRVRRAALWLLAFLMLLLTLVVVLLSYQLLRVFFAG